MIDVINQIGENIIMSSNRKLAFLKTYLLPFASSATLFLIFIFHFVIEGWVAHIMLVYSIAAIILAIIQYFLFNNLYMVVAKNLFIVIINLLYILMFFGFGAISTDQILYILFRFIVVFSLVFSVFIAGFEINLKFKKSKTTDTLSNNV
jgi:hypothetical protein